MEKAMAPHSSTFAWKTPWAEEPGRLQSMGSLRVRHDWATSFHFSLSCIGEGNGNPLQCSCLENPRDGGVWWAAVYGVAQSQTRLKRLSSSSSSMKTEYGRSHTFTRGMGLLLGMKDKVGTEESERIFWVRMKGKEEALIQHPGSTCLGSCYQWEEIISSFLFI